MTAASLHDVLARWETDRQSQRDGTKVTPSDAGSLCRRQTAFRVNDVPRSDDPDPVTVATVGSLLHTAIALLWENHPDNQTLATEYALPQGGTLDTLRGTTNRREVRDTKTVSRSKFDAWAAADGPGEGVWQQVAEYAGRYWESALGGDTTYTIHMAVDALCRETGRCATYWREWTPDLYAAAQRTLASVEALRGTDPMDVPASRDGRGDWLCNTCPWLTACMGPDDSPAVASLDAEQAANAAADYVAASLAKRDADARMKAARQALRGAPDAVPGWRITWTDVPPVEVDAHVRKGYQTIKVTAI